MGEGEVEEVFRGVCMALMNDRVESIIAAVS